MLDASAEQLFDEVDEVNANMPIQLKNKASSNSLINKQGIMHIISFILVTTLYIYIILYILVYMYNSLFQFQLLDYL